MPGIMHPRKERARDNRPDSRNGFKAVFRGAHDFFNRTEMVGNIISSLFSYLFYGKSDEKPGKRYGSRFLNGRKQVVYRFFLEVRQLLKVAASKGENVVRSGDKIAF